MVRRLGVLFTHHGPSRLLHCTSYSEPFSRVSAPLLRRSILPRLIVYRLKGRCDRHAVVGCVLRRFPLTLSLCQFFGIDLIVNHAVLPLKDKLVCYSPDSRLARQSSAAQSLPRS